MFVLYDVVQHKWLSIVWSVERARQHRTTPTKRIAELPSELSEDVRNNIVPPNVFYEGIARYANTRLS